MKRRTQRLIALPVGVASAIVLIASIGSLTVGYVHAVRQAPIDEQTLAALETAAAKDATMTPALVAERDRQTQASLERSAKTARRARVLIAAAVLFLVCAKWLISLDGDPLPRLDRTVPRGPVGLSAARLSALRLSAARSEAGCAGAEPLAEEGHVPGAGHRPALDLSFVDGIVVEHGRSRDAVIPILQALQSHYRYLPEAAMQRVCERTEITPAQIVGVSSFYRQFRRSPLGEHLVRVCRGTACHVAGSRTISDEIRRYLVIPPGADTDADARFTIEEVACMGCCTLAPVVQIDGVTQGHVTPDAVPVMLSERRAAGRNGHLEPAARGAVAGDADGEVRAEIRIGLGSCCMAGGSDKVFDALQRAVTVTAARAAVKRVGCVGMCHRTPLVEAVIPGQPSLLYAAVRPGDVEGIVRRHFPPRGIRNRVRDAVSAAIRMARDNARRSLPRNLLIERRDPAVAAFLDRQKRIATEHCGDLDPTDLDEYLRHGGFQAWRRCVTELTPSAVLDEIQRSGLRGRGGAGFPTGLKWSRVRAAPGDEKYIVCNGDEGDPGAFMDRMLMESFPYRIIEGAALAAWTVGAGEVYFYIRREYPLAVQRIRNALRQCEDRGILAEHLLGGRRLRFEVMEAAGAFVCGEETALLASLEGRRGMPTLRPPYPAESGLWGKPTLVGNVETLAVVPWIMRNGAAAFAALGTPASTGTKVFALAGKVNRGGLIEVPMGVTIREIVEDIGGGVRQGRRFKAVQIGGPSGGCVPAALADTPVDYDALTRVGAIMGSGGLVVLDDTDCMVDIARYFLSFTQDQSCGKCTYCRIGTRRMLDILERLCTGRASAGDLDELESLARAVGAASLCGLGKTAPNPVLTTLRYFREEYEAHLQGRCPAGTCKALIRYRVTEACSGCTLCAQHCPVEAIAFTPYRPHEIDDARCTRCGICRLKCPESAIEVE